MIRFINQKTILSGLLLFLLILVLLFKTINKTEIYPEIKEISQNFYVAKIQDKDLYLVMEQIHDKETQSLWVNYGKVQFEDASIGFKLTNGKFTNVGSARFKDVLENVSFIDNEIWVAYITDDKDPKPIKNQQELMAKRIKMFMTVMSSPKALLTTHMGISKSIEALLEKTPSLSMDLHSFAAKVMLKKNPERKYLMTSPTLPMEKIMAEALPTGSIFAGTKQMIVSDKYPPLLSVDGHDGNSIKETFTIFDKDHPDKIWLSIHGHDPNYLWLFTKSLIPRQGTHYILADLKTLAELKK